MKQTLKIMAISALATAAVIKAVPAFAEPVTGAERQHRAAPPTSTFTTAAGRAALDHRLVTAAYEVCGTPSDADLVGKNQARAVPRARSSPKRAPAATALASRRIAGPNRRLLAEHSARRPRSLPGRGLLVVWPSSSA